MIPSSRSVAAKPKPEEKWLLHASKPARVLFLDDDLAVCITMQTWCSKLNVELVCTHTIKHAVDIFEQSKDIDAMILDVRVSNGTGMELYARVMRERPMTHVVFLTGYDSPQVRDQIEKIGPARVHSKVNAMNPTFLAALFLQWGITSTTMDTVPPFPSSNV